MDENADFDVDPALAASMGFSAFGQPPATKRRKYNTSLDAVVDQSTGTGGSASQGTTKELGVRSKGAAQQETSHADDAATSAAGSFNNGPERAYGKINFDFVSGGSGTGSMRYIEKTLDQMTHTDLNALKMGMKNEHGDSVYFLPSFVEDPWAKLVEENGKGLDERS